MKTITTPNQLLSLSVRPVLRTVRRFFIRLELRSLDTHKQILAHDREVNAERQKAADRRQVFLIAELNHLNFNK